jgi:uncharacterized protein (TIGR02453 family)
MFKGFTQDTMDFLYRLRENNNKQWMDEHRHEYKEYVFKPFRQLAAEMGPMMLSIDTELDIRPHRMVSRINRDIRFSKNKSPYRANMWVSFKRLSEDWKQHPTYFFELFPEYYSYGMGIYRMPREVMDQLRIMIDERDDKFMKIHRLYQKQNVFTMEGEKYKRIRNKSLPEDLLDWYQRKEIYFICNRVDDLLYCNQLIDVMMEHFQLIQPIYEFFKELSRKRTVSQFT